MKLRSGNIQVVAKKPRQGEEVSALGKWLGRGNVAFRRWLIRSILIPFTLLATYGSSRELWILDPRGLNTGEQALLASVQGNLNRSNAVLWIRGVGANAWVLNDLQREKWLFHTNINVWSLIEFFRPHFAGFVTCVVTNTSLNVATSLAGSRQALIADSSLKPRLEALGLRQLLDVRELNEKAAFTQFRAEFAQRVIVHQPIQKALHLRDFAVSQRAFTFFDASPAERSQWVHELGPGTRVFGWGREEYAFVREVSEGGGMVVPADWALNLSALQHLKVEIPRRPTRAKAGALKPNERVVAFVVTDGDNLQWLLNGFVEAKGFWASPGRGRIPVSWELAPTLVEFAPRVAAHLYATATTNDDFVAGPSGAGYWFPSMAPNPSELAKLTAGAMAVSQLNLVSALNSGGGLDGVDALAVQPGVDGILYKDYAPYNKWGGTVRWHGGKPIISYRHLLWEQTQSDGTLRLDWLPEGVAKAIGDLPAGPTRDGASFALINVHAWSFRNSGGPMGAIERTVNLLPPDTRVVTAAEFIQLMMGTQGKP